MLDAAKESEQPEVLAEAEVQGAF